MNSFSPHDIITTMKWFSPLFLLVFLLCSCQTTSDVIPDWVSLSPEDSAEKIFFTASGSDTAGSTDTARINAEAALIQEIMSSMGVSPSFDTDPVAREAFEELNNRLVSNMGGGSSDASCFNIIDMYTNEEKATVYILASCSKELFDEEQRKLRELFSIQRGSILKIESEGDRLFDRDSWYRASLKFLEAACEAFGSGLTSRQIMGDRLMMKAEKCLENMEIEIETQPLSVIIEHDFPGAVKGKTVPGNMPLLISAARKGGPLSELSGKEALISGRTGAFEFLPDPVHGEGDYTLTVQPDYSSYPDLFKGDTAGFLKLVKDKAAVYRYSVENPAKHITMGLLIQDVSSRGTPVYDRAAAGIQQRLEERGFKTVQLTSPVNEGEETPRIVLTGKAVFSGFLIRESGITVNVKGSVSVLDRELDSTEILGSGDISVSAEGESLEAAGSEAFFRFGLQAADQLIEAYSDF